MLIIIHEKNGPPSTMKGVFVINDDSWEARKRMAWAHSSEVPVRPIGCDLSSHSRVPRDG